MLSANLFAFLDSLRVNWREARLETISKKEMPQKMSKQVRARVNNLKLMLGIHQQGQRDPKQQHECSRNDKIQREFSHANYFCDSLHSPELAR